MYGEMFYGRGRFKAARYACYRMNSETKSNYDAPN